MTLFSPEGINKSPKIYVYVLWGGLGSLLMLFLVYRSLPFNQQEA
ncbi:MAG: hypothetical protein ACFCAD_19530 [Pleurocapsa sp.]